MGSDTSTEQKPFKADATKAKAKELWEDKSVNLQIIAYLDKYEKLTLQGLNFKTYNGEFFDTPELPVKNKQLDPLCLVWSAGPSLANRVFYYDIGKQKYNWSSHKRMNFLRFMTVKVGKDLFRYRESIDGRPSYIRKYRNIIDN